MQELIDEFVSDAYISGDPDAEETDRNDSAAPVGEDSDQGDTSGPPFGKITPPPSIAKTTKKVSV